MRIRVSLVEQDIEFLDRFAALARLGSRSAAIRQAIRALRVADSRVAYESAWEEFEPAGEPALWDSTVGDGMRPA